MCDVLLLRMNNQRDYKYQSRISRRSLKSLFKGHKCVVSAACGGGKTSISHLIINGYIKRFGPKTKVLILTENQNVLKDQYLNSLKNAHTPINFKYGGFADLSSNIQVKIGLYSALHRLDWENVDLLVVDEAHRYFSTLLSQEKFKRLNVTHQLLLTGSPSVFIKANQIAGYNKYDIHFVSGDELTKKGIYSNLSTWVHRSGDKKSHMTTISSLLKFCKRNNINVSKTMVVCPSVSYAQLVGKFLESIGKTVFISTSESDKDSSQIEKFKTAKDGFLILCNRGLLGFNEPTISTVFDIKSSLNSIDNGFQLLARVLRKHPQNIEKHYIRVSNMDSNSYNKQVLMLHKLVALMKGENYRGFNGKNLKLQLG